VPLFPPSWRSECSLFFVGELFSRKPSSSGESVFFPADPNMKVLSRISQRIPRDPGIVIGAPLFPLSVFSFPCRLHIFFLKCPATPLATRKDDGFGVTETEVRESLSPPPAYLGSKLFQHNGSVGGLVTAFFLLVF